MGGLSDHHNATTPRTRGGSRFPCDRLPRFIQINGVSMPPRPHANCGRLLHAPESGKSGAP
jgi:hypothetical protein